MIGLALFVLVLALLIAGLATSLILDVRDDLAAAACIDRSRFPSHHTEPAEQPVTAFSSGPPVGVAAPNNSAAPGPWPLSTAAIHRAEGPAFAKAIPTTSPGGTP